MSIPRVHESILETVWYRGGGVRGREERGGLRELLENRYEVTVEAIPRIQRHLRQTV